MYQKVGLYVYVPQVNRDGGYGMQYDILRQFADRGHHRILQRATAYITFDANRSDQDSEYDDRFTDFTRRLRDFEYRVNESELLIYEDQWQNKYYEHDAESQILTDLLLESRNLDTVVLVCPTGALARAVEHIQSSGVRVEVVYFNSMPYGVAAKADACCSGYMIPDLLQIKKRGSRDGGANKPPPWGDVGSRVRGLCYMFNQQDKFGFIRYLWRADRDDLWNQDPRAMESSYRTCFVHASQMPEGLYHSLPSRDIMLEFDLVADEKGMQGHNVEVVTR